MAKPIAEQVQNEVDYLVDSKADSTKSEVRYMAYASRIRTALRASTRYIAYVSDEANLLRTALDVVWELTSDIGEAFRPVISPRLVTAAYGISWAYLVGDVSYETYKAHRQGPTALEASNFSEPTRLVLVAVQRGTFQAVASMGLPALTIHTIVAQSSKFYRKNAKSPRVKSWGPTLTGLAVVPLLPYLFDGPVEHVTDMAFDWIRRKWSEGQASKVKKEL